MSKQLLPSWDPSEPAPSYEESIAPNAGNLTKSATSLQREKSPSNSTSLIRLERTRRIQQQITDFIVPCFLEHLSNAVNNLTILLVPSDCLSHSGPHKPITAQNVVSPSFQVLNTTGSVIEMTGDGNRSSFWIQQPVLNELDILLRRKLTGVTPQQDPLDPAASYGSSSRSPTQQNFIPQSSAPLPSRPAKKSWFKRAMPQLPGPEHDPTGETGKWDLGWRSPDVTRETEMEAARQKERESRVLRQDEIAVSARFRDVSFRMENEMGLLETNTIKCVWIEIEVGV
ncbi:hypothetical protein B0A52_07227 [Exophiala mesophila]|uniref:Uncharacterized protein n=1 Tax=Exophiala mesophila TaxID=212818 RepID=A0A438N0K1_EXOME|nr:hypothetical protein B0A52_07227 [Exophiala mesophila]